jgi:glutathione reductase (NADPH)
VNSGHHKKFDLVVIGTGSAASTVASRCRQAGWTVAVIDSRPFGGTCALRGCDPKKVLVGAAEAIEWPRRLRGRGVASDGVRIEWSELIRHKRSMIEAVPQNREKGFAMAGIEAFHGRARFVGPNAVRVGDDVLEGRYVHIAAGARPADVPIPGREHLVTSEAFLELDGLPRRILFVGGGYISFEFAHVAARAGADVTMLHRGTRPLIRFDPDLVDQLVARTRQLGVDVHLETDVVRIEKVERRFLVHARTDSVTRTFGVDLVVHGAGRVPEIDDLQLDEAGVHWDRQRGVTVNQYLQSVSNPAVYAAGDAAASGPPLTPVAGYEARIVAANLLNGNRVTADYSVVPSVVFTIPPLASVGLQEQAARDQGRRFTVKHGNTAGWYSSRRVGETSSGYKVLVEEDTGRILGAHLLGPQAEETINLFAVAMRWGKTASDMREVLFAYPTHASDVAYMV